MNHDQVKTAIQKKEAELKAKREYTLELFNLIKDECVEIVTQKQIECNFEHTTELYDIDIVKAIIKHKGIDVCSTDIDIDCIHGVQNAWIRMSIWSRPTYIHARYNLSEEALARVMEHNDKEERKRELSYNLIESIDAPLLMTSLRNYIISKGFKGKSYTHRFTEKRCDVMEFETTKQKLLNPPSIHTADEQSTIYTVLGVLGALVIFGLFYLLT